MNEIFYLKKEMCFVPKIFRFFWFFCFLRITNFQIYDVMIDITAYFKMNFLLPLLNAFEY